MILAFLALLAATTSEPAPPPEVVQAANTWATCLVHLLEQAEDNVRPEIVADAMIANCRPEQDAARALHVRWIEGSNLSDPEKASALRALDRSTRGLRGELVRQIRADRRQR